MKKSVAELEGIELDHWVYNAINVDGIFLSKALPKYSTDWSQAGPIIECEGISLMYRRGKEGVCSSYYYAQVGPEEPENFTLMTHEKPLVAAMRAFVASKFGEYVEI